MPEDASTQACDVCGRPAVVVIETVAWCDACFHQMGSCCGEWRREDEKPDALSRLPSHPPCDLARAAQDP